MWSSWFFRKFFCRVFKQKCSITFHRGPDNKGIEYIKKHNIGLGHTRLSILDLSIEGKQPMFSTNGNIIIYNGEIYNYKSLKNELINDGFKFKSQTDTEVILYLYEKYGVELIKYLNGIFAFAIYDNKLNKIFITRDNFGVKPLYYYLNENGIIFASEIKAITNFVDFSKDQIFKKSIRNHLTYLFNPSKNILLNNLKKLSPGEYMIIHNGKIEKNKNWFNLAKRNITYIKPPKNFKKIFALKFDEAVQRQMISDVPVGALLSGGLDSSAIVAFASQINNQLPCFTIANQFDNIDGFVDDLPYARRVAKIFKLPLFEVEIKPSDLIENLYKTVSILEEPLADPAALNVLFISQLAKSKGVKVLLSGTGGDDILTGYRRHTAIKFGKFLNYLTNFSIKFINKFSKFSNFSNLVLGDFINYLTT